MMLMWLSRFRWMRRVQWSLADTLRAWAEVLAPAPRAVGADTLVPTGAAEAAEAWAADIWKEHLEEIFWGPYIKDSRDAIIVRKMELEKGKGETINHSMARQLTGDGILDDNRQEDNEEAVEWFSDDVTLRQFRNAVRLAGKLSEKRTAFNQGELAKDLLRDWLAGFLDNRVFVTIATSPTRAIYGGDATSTATIESGDFLTLPLLTQAKTVARKATPQIRPPRVKEGEYYVFVMSPDVNYDLKTRDPGYNEAHKEAMQRGPTNPLFTGAEFIYDGVIGRVCTRVPLTTDWGSGSNLNGAENLFLGLRTGVLAIGRKPDMVIQAFDYENKIGFAIRIIAEIAKATFDGNDHGVIAVRTNRSNLS